MAHLADLHESGHLLAAGPLSDEKFRGLSILRVDVTRLGIEEEGDPAVQAGRFFGQGDSVDGPGRSDVVRRRLAFPRSIAEASSGSVPEQAVADAPARCGRSRRRGGARRREACESSVRVRPCDRKPQTSRSSSSFVKTRCGSLASFSEQLVLLRRQDERAARPRSRASSGGRSRSRRRHPLGLRRRDPPQHRADPRDQLVVVERPVEVVVAAAVEGAHPVDGIRLLARRAGSPAPRGPRRPALAKPAAELEPLRIADQDEVGTRPLDEIERFSVRRPRPRSRPGQMPLEEARASPPPAR